MDEIEILIRRVSQDREFQKTRFTSKFLNDVADIFEIEGFGVTENYLLDKQKRVNSKWQASMLLRILELFKASERIKQNRRIGRMIIKNLDSIKTNLGGR